MDPVKMKFALALWLSLGFAVVGPVSAQWGSSAADLSATIDGVRGRCGLGLLARTSSSQTCQGFKDYGSRMQCVADDLGDKVRIKDAPALGDVARCYRQLGDALLAGRGANSDQVNSLEDICRTLRHEVLVPRSPMARDVLMLASDALMPVFSRTIVSVPPGDPMRGIRLQDMPDCGLATAVPAGPPTTAATSGSGRDPRRSVNGVTTAAIPPVRIVSLAPTPGVELIPSAPAFGGAGLADSQPAGSEQLAPVVGARPSANAEDRAVSQGSDKSAEGPGDRNGARAKGRKAVGELNSATVISESAVISALPTVSAANRKLSKRSVARAERSPFGYGATATDAQNRVLPRTTATPLDLEGRPGSRSSDPASAISGYSAASPPSLPLMGPPLRPQSAASVR
jgi:hypothetical protein